MKYVKTLGPLAVVVVAVVVALMPFADIAAASQVTSPPGTIYTGTIKAESEGYATWHNAVGTVSCNSTFQGQVDRHGSSVTAGATLSSFTMTGCTNGSVHTPIVGGVFEFHPLGNGNATLTWTSFRMTTTMFGVECGYSTNNTHLGEVTGGLHGTLDIKVSIPRTHGSFFCGSVGNWTGAYKFTVPTNMAFS